MNRIILFRGKRTDNGEWVEGFYILIGKRAYIVCEAELDCTDGENTDLYAVEWYEVDPETICQYTGLPDKNGRKIFEVDICKTHYANAKRNEFVETIVFNGGRFCAFQNKEGCKSWAGLYDGVPHLSVDKSVYMDEIEVIGNIFDNPELLEVGMRLIDADKLIEEINSYQYDTVNSEIRKIERTVKAHICELVEKQPTAYDVDKVVERLEEMRDTITHNISLNSQGENVDEEILNEISHYQKIIKIVKSGGIDKA